MHLIPLERRVRHLERMKMNAVIFLTRKQLIESRKYSSQSSLGGEKERQMGRLLLRWVVREGDTFRDVALQAFYSRLEESLFAVVEAGEWVVDFLCSGCLVLLGKVCLVKEGRHTPSSTGTEKNSRPVSLKTSSPPGIPCT